MSDKKVVFVVYYSTYGHVTTLAKQIMAGLEQAGVEAKLWQVAETLPAEVLSKMHAPPKAADVPTITAADLVNANGIIFGMPTRFGMVPAQVKALFDACGQLWMSGALKNKFVGTFFSTGSQGGGQETTAFTTLPFFAHMGMIYVSCGGKFKHGEASEVNGGSAWGAGTIASGHGSRQPSEHELGNALAQGLDFGKIVKGSNF